MKAFRIDAESLLLNQWKEEKEKMEGGVEEVKTEKRKEERKRERRGKGRRPLSSPSTLYVN